MDRSVPRQGLPCCCARGRAHSIWMRRHRVSRPDSLLDLSQHLRFRFRRVVLVERITTADQTVAWRGRAIAERAADELFLERAFFDSIGQDVWIRLPHVA